MRYLIYNPAGRYISHELAAPEWASPGDALTLALPPEENAVALSREQMFAEHREALERWESGNDSAFEIADAAQLLIEESLERGTP